MIMSTEYETSYESESEDHGFYELKRKCQLLVIVQWAHGTSLINYCRYGLFYNTNDRFDYIDEWYL